MDKLMIERVTRAIYAANPHTRVNKLVGDQYEPVPWEIASGNTYMEEYRLQALAAIMAINSYKHSLICVACNKAGERETMSSIASAWWHKECLRPTKT